MKMKSLMLAGALALAGSTMASAKSYDIVLSSPAQAGTLQLAAGEYKVKVEGASAVFTNVESGHRFTAPVKIANAPRKFDTTAVESTQKDGTLEIVAIDLGGSSTQLEFTE
jgi:hypothetical protein